MTPPGPDASGGVAEPVRARAFQPAYLPALTSLRGVAAWWVVLFHFRDHFPDWVPAIVTRVSQNGYLAVDLFFQLSGLVIALNYDRQFRSWSAAGMRRFLILRVARIYPLHFVMLLVFLINPLAIMLFSAEAEPGARYDPLYFVLSLLLVQNWSFTDDLAWNVPAWSISTEWFAYLAFPLLIFALRLPKGIAAILAAYAALAATLAGLCWVTSAGLGDEIPRLGLARCVLQFSMGICLYRIVLTGWHQGRAGLLLGAAAAGLAAFALLPVPDYLIAPVSMSCLILGLANTGSLPGRLMLHPWLFWLGEVSYSTYLVHYFIKDWVKFLLIHDGGRTELGVVVYLLATLAASAVLYRAVEVPGRLRVRRWFDV